MAEDLKEQLRQQQVALIASLYSQLAILEKDEDLRKGYQNAKIPDDKQAGYYDAMIDILNKQITHKKISEPKTIKFDQTEQERENLTKKELKSFKKQLKRQAKMADSYLAMIEPRCSLKGRLQAPGSIILRYRGQSVNDKFAQKYPYGVLM